MALFGVTAGCLGAGPDASATATPTPNTDCPPSLTVTEIPAERRATVRPRTKREGLAYAWHDNVAYEGRYYRTGVLVC